MAQGACGIGLKDTDAGAKSIPKICVIDNIGVKEGSTKGSSGSCITAVTKKQAVQLSSMAHHLSSNGMQELSSFFDNLEHVKVGAVPPKVGLLMEKSVLLGQAQSLTLSRYRVTCVK